MNLYAPIREGRKRGYAGNTELNNIGDFWKCQSQGFGSNGDYYGQYFTVPYPDGTYGPMKGHNGLDFAYDDGTPVYASHDGIAYPSEDSMKGLGVTLITDGYKTIYWHFKEFKVTNGQNVKTGDLLGLGDSTGFSTGNHLHYGLKLLDSSGNVLNRDNGFDGAVDPSPYMVWPTPVGDNSMTQEAVNLLYEILRIDDADGSGHKYWVGKPVEAFLKVYAKDRGTKLLELSK